MRRWILAWGLTFTTIAAARPVTVIVSPTARDRADATVIGTALLTEGGAADDDIVLLDDLDDLDAIADPESDPKVGGSDSLVLFLVGRSIDTEAGILVGGSTMPLPKLFERLGAIEAGSYAVVAAVRGGELDAETLLDLWPDDARPIGIVTAIGAEAVVAIADGLRHLAADLDADGIVDVDELAGQVRRGLGRDLSSSVVRPDDAMVVVSGLGGPDLEAPLLLVTEPRLRDDGPVLLEEARPLRVRGLVADNRRVDRVVVNARPAVLTPALDPALEGLGYAGRRLMFEAVVPLAEIGFTEVEVNAYDSAGNRSAERFLVLAGAEPDEPALLEAPATGHDRIEQLRIEWDQVEDWRFGFRVTADARVHGRRGRSCRLQVQFRFRDGRAVRDYNERYADRLGNAVAHTEFTPLYDHARVRDLRVFMPQRELHLTPGRRHELEGQVFLLDTSGDEPQVLAASEVFPFDVTEPHEAGTLYEFAIEHGAREGTVRGMRLRTRFNVTGLTGRACQLSIYLQRADGRALPDRNGRYRAGDGSVAVYSDFTPQYESADYGQLPLFLPYGELDLVEPGSYALRARAVVWDRRARRALDASPWVYFTVDQK